MDPLNRYKLSIYQLNPYHPNQRIRVPSTIKETEPGLNLSISFVTNSG